MRHHRILFFFTSTLVLIGFFLLIPIFFEQRSASYDDAHTQPLDQITQNTATIQTLPQPIKPSHITTPKQVKALYLTGWVAGLEGRRNAIIDLLNRTEANAVVIDIKDYTGVLSFKPNDPELISYGAGTNRIANLESAIEAFHKKGIYVIGRIVAFQDPYFLSKNLKEGVTDKTTGGLWHDRKGISWIDPGSIKAREYLVRLGQEVYERGFDELNFDYIRFPTDGKMENIVYPISGIRTKREVINEFFQYLKTSFSDPHIPISADIFGMTTTASDDMGIGQVFEDALNAFDYVAPMVYPSHFGNGWQGIAYPAKEPYRIITLSLGKGVERAKAIGKDPTIIRPWLQDFNLGATYTKEMVEAQIKATYDLGLNSWMLWDPANTYTESALEKEPTEHIETE